MARNVTNVATGSAHIVQGLTAVTTSAEHTTTEDAAGQLAATAAGLRAIIARITTSIDHPPPPR
ncbi:MAG TPA: hypothetical protein VJT31_06710 [Rugosimonospora sp.]|nr:hypothetical protein [Rugosimonospora sp.]